MPATEKAAPMRESDVLDALEKRALGKEPQGGGAVFLRQVRNNTGATSQVRTIDGLRIDMWPSRGLTVDAYEVKVSKSDLLHEIADPRKSDVWMALSHRFWLAVPTLKIIEGVDVPHTWGIILAQRSGTRIHRDAPRRPLDGVPIAAFAAAMRAAAQTTKVEYQRGYEAGVEAETVRLKARLDRAGRDALSWEERNALDLGLRIKPGIEAIVKAGTWNDGYDLERALEDPEKAKQLVDNAQLMTQLERLPDQVAAFRAAARSLELAAERTSAVAEQLAA
jgi:hypothetical protein